VPVERIEGLATDAEWQRAYDEINDFEDQLVERGYLLQKFWLHISPEEQLARFRARETTPYKQYKITEEDYRNRERWDQYAGAVNEMVLRTSSDVAPWYVIPADDKYTARIEVMERVTHGLRLALTGLLPSASNPHIRPRNRCDRVSGRSHPRSMVPTAHVRRQRGGLR